MRPVLVFDGDCGFCTRSARAAGRLRSDAKVEAYQALDLDTLGLTTDACSQAVQYVDARGQTYAGHLAIAAYLRDTRSWWRLLAPVLRASGLSPGWARLYQWVADHRHQLPGGTPACLPDAPPPYTKGAAPVSGNRPSS